ncbi:MAG: NAD(P)/FAD-dependent oxidoreductase [Fibrobacteraceae bacterium]
MCAMTMPSKLYDVLIVGKGPAGISAALYALRANLSVAIVAKDSGALSRAHLISNYYGLEAPIPGADLEKRGETQAKALGAEFFDGEVLDLMFSDVFELKTKDAAFKAKTVIVAAGAVRSKAPVPGLDAYEGKGVSYCAVCDGFFYRKKPVAVLGNGAFALAEAKELLPLASSVTICTLGKDPLVEISSEFSVEKEALESVEGNGKVERLKFASGKTVAVDGIFVALGSASAADLARKAGAAVEKNKLVVDEKLMTTVPGLFAAGDCLGGILQVAVAVGEGARAALGSIEFIRK